MIRKGVIVFTIIYIFFISSCNLYTEKSNSVPYNLQGRFISEVVKDENKTGALDCNFSNLSGKKVKEIYIVFLLIDEDGVPLEQNVIDVIDCVPAYENRKILIKLEDYIPLSVNSHGKYVLDFIYASKIIYEDGTEWTDPLGLKKIY